MNWCRLHEQLEKPIYLFIYLLSPYHTCICQCIVHCKKNQITLEEWRTESGRPKKLSVADEQYLKSHVFKKGEKTQLAKT